MEGLTLLQQASAAGLIVEADGAELVIRGPRRSEAVARMLLAYKPVVMAVLTRPSRPADAWSKEWIARHAKALAFWRAFHPPEEAASIAWGEMVNLWHRRHGARVSIGICPGCGGPIGEGATLTLGGGAAVHLATLDCAIRYGERWRGAASAALAALGLDPPGGA